MALILRNGGSQSPDRWLKEPRNNQNVSEVDLSDNLSDFYDKLYIKMADGNIVVADAEYLDEIDYDTNLMYFNTKKGSFTETSYERLEDKYDVEESWEDCILYKKYVD